MTRPLFFKRLGSPHPKAAAVVIVAAGAAALALAYADSGALPRAWPFVAGIVFGVALQRGELSLVRGWRDLLMLRDGSQLLGFLTALGVAATLTLAGLALLGAAEPPANARIGPVSWLLPVAAFVFGAGSVIARGGLMVHLRRLGEGSLIAAPALLATFAGFVIGVALWPWTWRVAVADAPYPALSEALGFWGALAVQLMALAILAALLRRFRPKERSDRRAFAARLMVEPWHPAAAGALLGALVAASYAAGEPLGLISECAAAARWLATAAGLAPVDLPGLDAGVGGIAVPLQQNVFALTGHVVIVFGFLVGAFAAALASGRFAIAGLTWREAGEMVVGGLLLGLGAMTALGAVTGEAIAGVAIGALSGWVFLAFASLGIIATLKLTGDPSALKG